MIRFALLLVLIWPGAASAGPWPREVGESFLSLSVERNRADNSYASLYGEYGLRPRTTLGLEAGRAVGFETSVIVWLQRALDDGQGPNRLAMQAGFGAIGRDGSVRPVVQSAMSWGRGFDRWGGGWMTAQLLAKMTGVAPDPRTGGALAASFLTAECTIKADLTLGLRPRQGLMVVGNLWLEDRQGEELSAKLAPALVLDIAGPAQIELGLVEPLTGPAERAVRVGSWIAF